MTQERDAENLPPPLPASCVDPPRVMSWTLAPPADVLNPIVDTMTCGAVVTRDADTRCAIRWFVGVPNADVAASPGPRVVGWSGRLVSSADRGPCASLAKFVTEYGESWRGQHDRPHGAAPGRRYQQQPWTSILSAAGAAWTGRCRGRCLGRT